MCRTAGFGLLLTVLGLPEPLGAQSAHAPRASVSVVAPHGGATPRERRGLAIYSATRGDSLAAATCLDRNEVVPVVVQFRTPPPAHVPMAHEKERKTPQVLDQLSALEGEHTSFRTDLTRILTPKNSSRGSRSVFGSTTLATAGSAIRHEYRRVLNGLALRVPHWAVGEIQHLPYVKSVRPDRPIKALDAAANRLIGSDSVTTRLGLTGQGVRLGFLDTGIDYRLAEFGGGLGEGSRTRGGWDFVNGDSDPFDDNGHGTEVASLAAADGTGTAQGVAPEATLYIYKVLDDKGDGMSSLAIAALERALSDSVQILNLSFGGPGDPSDPLSEAIDNATRAGVLCVAASGNGGPGYQTITSPGCASLALTVGGSDLADQLADFSSRGPTNMAFTLKPDLIAPAVGLSALAPGGGSSTVSGTSFSTPLAAGTAALLKELHPDWTPLMLKSALLASAQDLGGDLWRQGKGRLDVLQAAQRQILVLPQTLSLGMDDLTMLDWIRSDTLTLVNTSDVGVNYELQGPPSGSLPAGISMYLSSPSVTVPPHGQGKVALQTIVDNSLAKIPSATPPAITGLIRCTSTTDTLNVPFALLLGSYIDMEVASTLPIPFFWFANTDGTLYRSVVTDGITYQDGKYTLRRLVKPGTYDICVQLGWDGDALTWLLRDSVVVNPAAKVVMDQSEALYTVGTIPLDEQGQPLDSALFLDYVTRLYSRRTGCSFGLSYSDGPYGNYDFTNKLPHITSNWIYDYVATSDRDAPKVYSYALELDHVEADHVVRPKAGDLTKRTVDYRFHTPVQELASIDWFAFQPDLGGFGWYQPNTATSLAAPYQQQWFSTGEPVENFPHNQWYLNYRELFSYSGTPPFYPYESPYLMTVPNQHPGVDGLLRSTLMESKGPALETRGKKVIYGLGPRFYYGRTENTASAFKVKTNTWLGQCVRITSNSWPFVPCFLNQCLDFTPSALIVRLFDAQGQLLGQSYDAHYFTRDETPDRQYNDYSLSVGLAQPGRYTVELTDTSSYVLNRRGTARALLTADTRLADKNPPSMAGFTILADSEHADQILPGPLGEVQAVVSDPEGALQTVQLFYRTDADTNWRALPLTSAGAGRFQYRNLAALPEAYVSLRLVATDPSGNTLDYRAEPAFYHGIFQNHAPLPARNLRPGLLDTVQLYTTAQPVTFHWQQTPDPDLDSLHYRLHLWGMGLDTTVSGLTDTLASLLLATLQAAEDYHWTIETSDGLLSARSDTGRFWTASTLLAAREHDVTVPMTFTLEQNYPNPFNPMTTIRYGLPSEARVSLKVYNVLGQEIMTLVEAEQRAGRYSVDVSAMTFASGVYFYRLQAVPASSNEDAKSPRPQGSRDTGTFVETKRFLVVK